MSNFKDEIQQKFETMTNRLNTKENNIINHYIGSS